MKRALHLVTCLCLLSFANGQVDSSKIKYSLPSDSTVLGTPDGKLVGQQIGSTGGRIVSDDGRIELVFPAGALTTNTTISIQPTTNPAPNGTGKAYWFEPSGTQFKKPVQFIFHYTNEEAEACEPELMALALQDKKGKWSFFEYEEWDSSAKTLKGFIHHFTGATNVFQMWMMIGKDEISVNEKIWIDFVDITSWLETGRYEEAVFTTQQNISWTVNTLSNGSPLVGTITPQPFRLDKKTKMMPVTYTAPDVLPRINPVEVEAKVYVKKGKKKELLRTFRNICN